MIVNPVHKFTAGLVNSKAIENSLKNGLSKMCLVPVWTLPESVTYSCNTIQLILFSEK